MIENIFRSVMIKFPKAVVYEVGGVVRDRFISGFSAMDQDYLITNIPFGELIKFLNQFGRVEHVGATFGVLKFYERGSKIAIDIAIPRKDVSTGPGHKDFKVEFNHTISLKDDLYRRDFTMNAIAHNLKNDTYEDPYGGKKDIVSKLIRTISKKAFEEDPLRILRGAQFAARFQFTIEDYTLKLMKNSVHLLTYISVERIAAELNKLLMSTKPSIGLRYLYSIGVLKILLPELVEAKKIEQTRKGGASSVFEHTMLAVDAALPDNLEIRWAALLHDLGKPKCHKTVNGKDHFIGHESEGSKLARKFLTRLKFPTVFITKVSHLIRMHMFDAAPGLTPKAVRRLIKKVGPEHIFDLLALRRADRAGTTTNISMWKINNLEDKIRKELADKPFSIQDLNIDGLDVMRHTGLLPSPAIGMILNILLHYVLYKDVKNEKDVLLSHIPHPGEGTPEYCPHGTIFRLTKIIEYLTSEKPYTWNCGGDCGYICQNKD